MKLFKRLFKKKRSLRDVCVELYGEEFGIQYDTLASGGTIGGFDTTIMFLEKLELARMVSNDAGKKLKQKKGEKMKAIITVDVPEHQIGQEVSVYFKDTMCVNGTCESETEVYAKHDEEVIKETVESIWGKSCDDAISRQAVLNHIDKYSKMIIRPNGLKERILDLPSVNPQNDVFDKIRAEIEKECEPCIYEIDFAYKKGLSRTLEIIDKYRKGEE